MKKSLILLLLFIATITYSQSPSEIQKEINSTVWKPFHQAFENLDSKALNNIYAKEVLRVTPKGIDTEGAFKKGTTKRFKENKKQNTKIKLDFWFDSRHTNSDTSYEVGFYKITFTTNGKASFVYGQFHIVLKKIKGEWKITQDWDTTTINGEKITAVNFGKKRPISF